MVLTRCAETTKEISFNLTYRSFFIIPEIVHSTKSREEYH